MHRAVLRTRWVTAGAVLVVCLASAQHANGQHYGRSHRYGHRPSYRRPDYHRPTAYVAPRSIRYYSPTAYRRSGHFYRPDYRIPTYPRADYRRPSYRWHRYPSARHRSSSRYHEPIRVHPRPTYGSHAYWPGRHVGWFEPRRPLPIYRPVRRHIVQHYDPCATYLPRPQPYYIRRSHPRHCHGGYGFGFGFSRGHHGRGWGFSIGGGHGAYGRGGGFSFYYYR
jgi:hypothetical protein